MNTLHAVPAPVPVFTEGRPMPLTPTCSNCGSHEFVRIESGNYSERHSINFDGAWPSENWDRQETETMESDPWECWNCDTRCPPDLQDLIDDSR